jgi:hypothetical protein
MVEMRNDHMKWNSVDHMENEVIIYIYIYIYIQCTKTKPTFTRYTQTNAIYAKIKDLQVITYSSNKHPNSTNPFNPEQHFSVKKGKLPIPLIR